MFKIGSGSGRSAWIKIKIEVGLIKVKISGAHVGRRVLQVADKSSEDKAQDESVVHGRNEFSFGRGRSRLSSGRCAELVLRV